MLFTSCAAFAGSATSYDIHPGDVLHVSVFGKEGLSGDYPVAPDGTIGYPVVGSVHVAGMTVQAVSAELSDKLKKHVPGLSVAASIGRYSPVYVLGEVKTPGKYEYQPGMITLELLALAGGVAKPATLVDTAQVQIVATKQEYADLELQLIGALAKRARYQAELNGSDFTAPMPSGIDPVLRKTWQDTVAGEKKLFDLRKSATDEEDQALAGQQQSYKDEIGSISESIKLYDDEIKLAQEDVASAQKLAAKGLTARSNLREMQRRLSELQRDQLQAVSYLARAKQNLQAIGQQRLTLVDKRRSEAAAALQDLDIQIARLRQNQKSLLSKVTEIAAASDDYQTKQLYRKLRMTVLRTEDGKEQEIAAGDRLQLEPGDILQVQFVYPKTLADRGEATN